MLHRRFDPTAIYAAFSDQKYHDFATWQASADAGTAALERWAADHPIRKRGESLPVDSDIYRALKPCLIAYFQGKCAYCESKFDYVAWGDVEHYRPKRKVVGETHPGYYWLAYRAHNLMPSCQLCNQGPGKANHFPIDGKRAMSAQDDLFAELPKLLNPYEEDDCELGNHIRFVIERSEGTVLPTGRVEGVTERGKESVARYRLDRPELRNRRRRNQQVAVNDLDLAAVRSQLPHTWANLMDVEQEHASAVRAACLAWRAAYIDALRGLPLP